eukprot:7731612-Pyramimonas_sp.AAC.1
MELLLRSWHRIIIRTIRLVPIRMCTRPRHLVVRVGGWLVLLGDQRAQVAPRSGCPACLRDRSRRGGLCHFPRQFPRAVAPE